MDKKRGFFSNLYLSLMLLAVCLLPTWILLAAYNLLDPADFWQKTLVIGVGLYLLGSIQLIALVIGMVMIVAIFKGQ